MVWDISGPSLEVIWEKLWSMYFYYVDLIWATAPHIKPIDISLFCSVVYCYGMTTLLTNKGPYILHSFLLGNGMVCPIAMPYDPHPVLWDNLLGKF